MNKNNWNSTRENESRENEYCDTCNDNSVIYITEPSDIIKQYSEGYQQLVKVYDGLGKDLREENVKVGFCHKCTMSVFIGNPIEFEGVVEIASKDLPF